MQCKYILSIFMPNKHVLDDDLNSFINLKELFTLEIWSILTKTVAQEYQCTQEPHKIDYVAYLILLYFWGVLLSKQVRRMLSWYILFDSFYKGFHILSIFLLPKLASLVLKCVQVFWTYQSWLSFSERLFQLPCLSVLPSQILLKSCKAWFTELNSKYRLVHSRSQGCCR